MFTLTDETTNNTPECTLVDHYIIIIITGVPLIISHYISMKYDINMKYYLQKQLFGLK